MSEKIAGHWGMRDVSARVMEAMKAASIVPETVTVEQMAPFDHLHPRGFNATAELADVLPVSEGAI